MPLADSRPQRPTHLSRSVSWARGLLLAGAAALLAQVDLAGSTIEGGPSWRLLTSLAAALGVALAAPAAGSQPRLAVALMWAGLGAAVTVNLGVLVGTPSLSLLALLAAIGTSFLLRRHTASPLRPAELVTSTARGAATISTAVWLFGAAWTGTPIGQARLVLAAPAVVAWLAILRWIARYSDHHPRRRAVLLATIVAVTGPLPFLVNSPGAVLALLALLPAVALFVLPLAIRPDDEQVDWGGLLFAHPPRLLVFTFALLCLAGSLALALPFCSATEKPFSYVDALFTAVSAVCVTGLIVLDTPVDVSAAGQVVIAVLIQLGALGIMTFSTAALGLLRRRMSLVHEGAVAGLLSGSERGFVFAAVKKVLLVTAVAEGAGALLLWMLFWGAGDPPLRALGRGLFTAVSAFCNAGFALQSASLIPYAENPWILHTVAALIIVGGISPFLVVRIPRIVSGAHARAQEKVVLVTTALLLAAGTILFLLFEWNATLAPFSFLDKLSNAWLQSVTLRTAGFNSVDLAQAVPPTTSFMLLWMFIGGSPGATAGGIKTTTAAVLALAVAATVRGHPIAQVFHRRIPHSTVYRATAIATAGVVSVVLAYMAVILTQKLDSGVALFEVVSALGTVGLSIGGTAKLDDLGKLIIVTCMFAGRLGPLTLFVFLSRTTVQDVRVRPEEEIAVG